VALDLDVLNSEQRAAVLAPDGPILILAGAGSGKTRAITYRIAHLLGERNADPREVLAVTFTNKAAGEMRERVAALLDGAAPPWVSTFHSACARILRAEARTIGFEQNFSILDEGDSMSLVRDVIEAAALADSPTPELARSRIEQAKNEAISPAELAAKSESGRDTAIAHIYRLYRERLRTINAMDFSDLQLLAYELFRDHPEILEKYQRRATHLMVDEYQDTNRVQYLLVKALSARSGNICVVGDEDQSIYKWRGADIRNILDFEHDFPNAQIFKLEQNYRSTKTILAAAGAVIAHNRERKEKTLWTENESGEKVTYFTAMTERDEADFIAREIASMVEANKYRPADVVVFYRVNAQSRIIQEAMVRRRLPYFVVGGHRFYELKEIRDLLAYLRVIANPADAVSLERLLGAPTRGIGARTIEVMKELAARENITMLEAMGRLETARDVALRIAKAAGTLYTWLNDLIARAPEMSIRAILDEVVERCGYIAYLEGMADGEQRRQNVAELLGSVSAFDNEKKGNLGEYLEQAALSTDTDALNQQGGSVALMTLHTSKGLEYPVVFLSGLEEGLFPLRRADDAPNGENIEEERRLCYVGMTRARELLYLTNTLSRELYGQRNEPRPSRFLAEIKQDLLWRIAPEQPARVPFIRQPVPNERYVDYSESQLPDEELAPGGLGVGTQVMHPTFGKGVIRKREGRGDTAKVWINFDRSGVKLLVLKFANLRPI
jgi:DNA helicase II / ATP-dependent DNA helicase PcrA